MIAFESIFIHDVETDDNCDITRFCPLVINQISVFLEDIFQSLQRTDKPSPRRLLESLQILVRIH
jgi:hypothetical protein